MYNVQKGFPFALQFIAILSSSFEAVICDGGFDSVDVEVNIKVFIFWAKSFISTFILYVVLGFNPENLHVFDDTQPEFEMPVFSK